MFILSLSQDVSQDKEREWMIIIISEKSESAKKTRKIDVLMKCSIK